MYWVRYGKSLLVNWFIIKVMKKQRKIQANETPFICSIRKHLSKIHIDTDCSVM